MSEPLVSQEFDSALKYLSTMYPRNYILTNPTVIFPLLNHHYNAFGIAELIAKLKDPTF